ncbi:MAG TPA: PD-(D/E)XK nuclease family protein [Candidatus Krumholzibacterium sp.]|nr:PD-(D/E)XK nuclease family protein [Candidatus Krumholzibacterium sp.]
MVNTIVTAEDYGRLETLLALRVGSIRRADPYSPVRILAGSDILCRHLKTSLSLRSGGLFNVEVMTFARLVAGAAEKAGLEQGPELPPLFGRMTIEQMREEGLVPEGFGAISSSGGFSSAMEASLEDLAEAGMTVELASGLAAKSDGEGRLGDLLRLFERYRRKVDDFGGDGHSLVSRILESSEKAGRSARRGGTGDGDRVAPPLLAYGFYDMNREQWDILRSTEKGGIVMFVPVPNGRTGRFARRFVEMAEEQGFVLEPPDEGEAGGSVAPEPAPSTQIFNAYDTGEEAGEIGSRVLELAGRGTPFSRMAVLTPPGYDDRDLRELLVESAIPVYAKEPPLLETDAGARLLLALASLMEGAPGRRQLTDILMMLTPAGVAEGTDGDPVATWVRRSADAGSTGEDGWPSESASLVEAARSDAEKGREDQSVVEALVFVSGVIDKVMRLVPSRAGRASWSSRVEDLVAVVEDLSSGCELLREAVESAKSLEGLDRVSGGCHPRLFNRMLSALLSRPPRSTSGFGRRGVHIIPLSEARGLRFEAVFIPGLTEDLVPGRIGRDPFLSDDSREFLELGSGGAVRFSRRSERPAELELILGLAAGAAVKDLFLSYPRREKGSGREKIPSSVIEKMIPGRVGTAHLRIPAGALLSGARRPLNEYEYYQAAVARSGERAVQLVGGSYLRRGMRMAAERWRKKRLTAWDGVITSSGGLEALKARLSSGHPGFPPTSLERYASCPFAFFIGDILGVSAVEEPEAVLTMDPMQRGILVHGIMEYLYGELERKGLLPVSRDTLAAAANEAVVLMDSSFEEYAGRHPTGPDVFWEIEKERISRGVLSHLDAEAFEQEGFVPWKFEYSFGSRYGTAPVRFDTGEREVEFFGRIDRVDRDAHGGFRVIDYKTGKLRGRDGDLGNGTALQLPVYLLAAASLTDRDIEAGCAQYVSVSAAGGKRTVSILGSEWKGLRSRFARMLDVIVGGIESGLFFCSPAKGGCRGCDASAACPSSRAGLFEMKVAGDERCEGFILMKQGELE